MDETSRSSSLVVINTLRVHLILREGVFVQFCAIIPDGLASGDRPSFDCSLWIIPDCDAIMQFDA